MARNTAQASDPPAVVVAYRRHPDCAQALREVCAGIEEEGVHSRTVALEATDAAALAYEAAMRSQLGVGVAVDEDELCVHAAALPADAPLERVRVGSYERACQRHVGHNAARLVKVMPLKGYLDGEETDALHAARGGWVGRRRKRRRESRRGSPRHGKRRGGQQSMSKQVTLDVAETVLTAARQKAVEIGQPMCIAVVEPGRGWSPSSEWTARYSPASTSPSARQ